MITIDSEELRLPPWIEERNFSKHVLVHEVGIAAPAQGQGKFWILVVGTTMTTVSCRLVRQALRVGVCIRCVGDARKMTRPSIDDPPQHYQETHHHRDNQGAAACSDA